MKKILLGMLCFATYILPLQAQTLCGTTFQGGSDGAGTINIFKPATNNLIVAKSFESFPTNPEFTNFIQASDGKLYGMTSGGGSADVGVIFSFDPVSLTYTKLKDFDNINGGVPYGSLIQARDGKLYGMTTYGGTFNDGVIFSFDPAMSSYTKLMDFNGANGANPYGSLFQANDGRLYGMTSAGGSADVGVIFSFDLSADKFTKLMDFNHIDSSGNYPTGSFIQARDGNLYGMTEAGGIHANGVIFSFRLSSSTYSKLKDFDGVNGSTPNGSLLQGSDGKLYGMTQTGGISDAGVIFSFDPFSSTYSKLKDFDFNNGAFPSGNLIQASDGNLYGMTVKGGTSNIGTIFSFHPSTAFYTKLKDFNNTDGALPLGSPMQASDGKLYAMTSQGGTSGRGIMLSYDLTISTYTMLKDFGTNKNGSFVSGSLTLGTDGKLYGMTRFGGTSGLGVIFSYDPSSSTYVKLMDFNKTNGAFPFGSLIQASDGKLYGITIQGGTNDYGVIFSYEPASSTYTKLKDFDNANGRYPRSSLIEADDGNLYGMTTWGGSNDVGVIFSFNRSSLNYTKLFDFDFYTNGGYPYASFLQANDRKLYATTSSGGSSQHGVIFSYDLTTSTYSKLHDFDYAEGIDPFSNLLQASDGKFYSLTFQGGNSGNGVIFSYDPASPTYTKLKDFDNISGTHPMGNLIQATDGKLYGMTEEGGSSGLGVIFSYDPSSSTFTKMIDYNGANGSTPYLGSGFIEVNGAVICNLGTAAPTITASSTNICVGGNTTLSISSNNLSSTTIWKWYTGSCGGTFVGSGTSITVSPTQNTTYYARGEGACAVPGPCGSITITISNTPPIITCPGNQSASPNHSSCSYLQSGTSWDAAATSNCGIPSIAYTLSGATTSATGALQTLNNVIFNTGVTNVTAVATDVNGNSSSCKFNVTVISTLSSSCTNTNPHIYFGVAGYDHSTITITPTGGTGPYVISVTANRNLLCNQAKSTGNETWTAGAGTSSSSNTVCGAISGLPVSTAGNISGSYQINVSLLADADITATITDASGCTTSCTQHIIADDARCFGGNSNISKVMMCHYTGSVNNPTVQICVDQSAVKTHLAQGDQLGSCNRLSMSNLISPNISSTNGKLEVKVLPNPATSYFNIGLKSPISSNVTMTVIDEVGRVIENKSILTPNSYFQLGRTYHPGVYFIHFLQDKNQVVVKLIKTGK